MKVLQLCHKPPYPVKDGGCLAINQITRALKECGNEVDVLSIVTPKHPFVPEAFPEGYLDSTNFKAVYVDTRLNIVDAFSNLITQDTYHVSRFFSSDVDMAIIETFENTKYDMVICESIYVAPYIPSIRRISQSKIILRSHNLEFSIWHRLARSHKAGLKKTYLKILTRQLKEYEVQLLSEIDGLLAINADELKHYKRLGYVGQGLTIPFGVELDQYLPNHDHLDRNSVFHLGSMDWKPNEEGIEWFLEEVWPLVIKQNKDVTLYLAGRSMSDWLLGLSMKQVKIIGEVEDAKDFIRSKNIMIIPLFSGGGMRVKMIEALALEKPVVSTPLGAKGVNVRSGKHAMIARSPKDFANAILELVENRELASSLGTMGRELISDYFDNRKLALNLNEFLLKIKE